jgi:hypothetical protein
VIVRDAAPPTPGSELKATTRILERESEVHVADRIIEVTWEDLIRREDLRGRRLRVAVIDEALPPELESTRDGQDPWVARLREWADSHPDSNQFLDDSRDAIYSGTVVDPR